MLAKDIRHYIIAPTLKEIDLWSESAEILVYGTGWVETGYNYLVQIGNPKNGGYGLFQDEPIDFNDLMDWLSHRDNEQIRNKILDSLEYCCNLPTDISRLMSDLKLAVICCRLHYWRAPNALPDANDAAGMANYHKIHYNQGGKADVQRNTETFQRIINNEI